jgi:hypothetical protein
MLAYLSRMFILGSRYLIHNKLCFGSAQVPLSSSGDMVCSFS